MIIRVLSFYAGGELYAADAALIQKVMRKVTLTPVPAAPREVMGIANLKGNVVTILDTRALFGNPDDTVPEAGRPQAVDAVIFKPPAEIAEQMGLAMDRPGDLVELDDSAIAPPPLGDGSRAAPLFAGVAESRGAFYRIVDPAAIVGRFRESGT